MNEEQVKESSIDINKMIIDDTVEDARQAILDVQMKNIDGRMSAEDKKKACAELAKRFSNEELNRAVKINMEMEKVGIEGIAPYNSPLANILDQPIYSRRPPPVVKKQSTYFREKDLAINFADSAVRSAHVLKEKIESENPDAVISVEEILNTKEFLMECATAFGNALGRKGIYKEYCVPTRIVKTRKIIKMARPYFSTYHHISQQSFYEGYNQMLSQLKNYEITFNYG